VRDVSWLIWARVGAVVLALLAAVAVLVEGGRLGLVWLRWIPVALLVGGAATQAGALYLEFRKR